MQAPADPPVLRHPDNFGVHREVNLEAATNMLIRALTMIQNTPFTWTFIDKPPEGQVYLIYLTQPQHRFPNDGIRWQEMETKDVVPVRQCVQKTLHGICVHVIVLSKEGVVLDAIFAKCPVGAGSNDARLVRMLRQLTGYYYKEFDLLMHKSAVLAALTAFTNAKGVVLDKHY
ncbi:putative rpn1-26s proteasome regulatory subunit [Moniliophthora roreri MCA 2997]|uniref:Rpn1-26s proteasome regulatory subunit n=1 Tax=Moniliophthora roreri (strain MCA 2997) TaxID=1381753 RepID=V2XH00_MONRO|nr:putative rpn1-26s proteasome regulatory subunit [Moniliophthora roreri MCA 2997]